MTRRFAALVAIILLAAGIAASAPVRGPVFAQEEPTELPTWPAIPTFQVPGTFATAGTIDDAGTVASLPGSIRVVASNGEGTALATDVGVELILDNSGSMLQALGEERRIDIAKRVLSDLVDETMTPGLPLALRVFGDVADSCDTSLAIPLQPLDRQAALAEIGAITSIDGVKTPIGEALEQIASDLKGVEGPKIVVLVTDGEETCGGRPQRAIRELVEQGIDVRVNIVGFAVDDEELKKQFEAWARAGGGQYFDASGADDLGEAIAAALQPPFEVIDESGAVIGSGVVGGEVVRVSPGTYGVEVLSDPPLGFADVAVGNGEEVVLELGEGSFAGDYSKFCGAAGRPNVIRLV